MSHTIEEILRGLPPLEVHPANKTPKMSPEKLLALKLDIWLQRKLVNPIWIRDGQLLDGKNKYEASRQLKAEGKLDFDLDIREWPFAEDDADEAFDSLNLHRQHFNPNQIAAFIALNRLEQIKSDAQERMCHRKKTAMEFIPEGKGTSYEIAARLYGSNSKYIQWADEIKAQNANYLDFVLSKQMTCKEGSELIKFDSEKANYIYAKLREGTTIYKDALAEYQKSVDDCEATDIEAEETTIEPKKSPGKKSEDVIIPTIIFTQQVDDAFAKQIMTLYSSWYATQMDVDVTYQIFNVKNDPKLARHIASISKKMESNIIYK